MIPLPELKVALRIPANDATEDTYLAQCEAAAVGTVAARTGLVFDEPAEAVRVLDGTGTDSLWLPQAPAGGDVVLEVRVSGGWEVVDPTLFELDGARLFHLGDGWTRGVRNYRASFSIGYGADGVPAAIRSAVIALTIHLFRERAPVVTGTIATEIPMHVADLLRPFLRLRVG